MTKCCLWWFDFNQNGVSENFVFVIAQWRYLIILVAGGVDESSWALEAQAWHAQEKILVSAWLIRLKKLNVNLEFD